MIYSQTMYGMRCDNCGEDYIDGEEMYALFPDELSIKNEAMELDWLTQGDKHYCPDCYSYNHSDELFINEERQKVKP